jgi:hypothetical protein
MTVKLLLMDGKDVADQAEGLIEVQRMANRLLMRFRTRNSPLPVSNKAKYGTVKAYAIKHGISYSHAKYLSKQGLLGETK